MTWGEIIVRGNSAKGDPRRYWVPVPAHSAGTQIPIAAESISAESEVVQ